MKGLGTSIFGGAEHQHGSSWKHRYGLLGHVGESVLGERSESHPNISCRVAHSNPYLPAYHPSHPPSTATDSGTVPADADSRNTQTTEPAEPTTESNHLHHRTGPQQASPSALLPKRSV